MRCPLCRGEESRFFVADRRREYHRCSRCALVFVPARYFLSAEAEKAEYDRHQNSAEDAGYRRFLDRLCEPLVSRLRPGSRGLDFGSGPGPVLSRMLEEAGHRVRLYDPLYAPDRSALAARYDFITASEVVEHLHRPRQELERLWRCLRPGGILGIMTQLVTSAEAFARWRYKDDPTHVCFFSEPTFRWLGGTWGATPRFAPTRGVVLFEKPQNP